MGMRNWGSRRLHARCFGRRFLRFLLRLRRGLSRSLGVGNSLEVLADLFRNIGRDGTRVRLLFADTIPRQEVNDGLGLDLEFAGQLVDSDLVYVSHACLGLGLF
jgi:hypothetical protein